MKFRSLALPIIVILLLLVGVISPLLGQGETIVTVAAQGWMSDVLNDQLFDGFEADHPGVKVVLAQVSDEVMYYGSGAWELDEHLESSAAFASSADVLMMSSYQLSVESTRAGHFLDLAPLINSDPNFNTDDFFPAAWQAVQWDGGIWAIPVSASVQMVVYNQIAFDEAGLSYPNDRWTMQDYVDAALALTTYDEDGEVEVPGMNAWGTLLIRALLGEGFYDPTTLPNEPRFDHPELPALLEKWQELQEAMMTSGDYDYNAVPLTINSPWQLTNPPSGDQTQKWAGSLLPGGTAGIDVQSFAVSAGTLQPELAYALANYLSQQPIIVNRFFGDSPARKSMVGVEADDDFFSRPAIPEDVQALIEQGLANGIPSSELRFSDYINAALGTMDADGLDIAGVLEKAQETAVASMQAASERRGSTILAVMTPVPTPAVAADQIVLQFGLTLYSSDIPNRGEWDQLIKEFTAAYPAVGNVDLKTQFFRPEDMEKIDCYYQPYNIVPDADLTTLVSLDPYMDADPAFDRSDFLGNTLSLVQRDGRTWAYPIDILPSVLWYNSETFSSANLSSPEDGWTVDEFHDALMQLQAAAEDPDEPVFIPESFSNTYLLLLAAAYGGVPYDYSTTPPGIHFTEPANVDALRQVLDLAKEGYIDYQQLVSTNFSSGGGFGQPIYGESFNRYNWRMQSRENTAAESDTADPYRLSNYPRGGQTVPMAYGIGAAYINAKAQNAEACYRWIAQLAKRPDLFGGVPVRRSQVNDPSLVSALGEDVVSLYQNFAVTISDPNALFIPTQYSDFNTYVETMWLNKTFDNYVLKDGNLETDLVDAERFISEYRTCVEPIPDISPMELTEQTAARAYYRQFADCAISVDPSLESQFSWYYQEEG